MTEVRPDDAPCVVDVARGDASPVVLVSFAGWAGGHAGVTAPEFSRTVEGLPADVVFLRDPRDCAYLDGVPGAGGSIAEVAAWLRDLCARKGARRVVTMGNSTGGWAAILFGLLIGADDVQAFAPKTRMCGPEDFHEPDRFPRVAQSIRGDGDLLDLREVLARLGTARTRISIHSPRHDLLGESDDARNVEAFGPDNLALIAQFGTSGLEPELGHLVSWMSFDRLDPIKLFGRCLAPVGAPGPAGSG